MREFGPEWNAKYEGGWQRDVKPELESHLPGNMGVQDDQSVDTDSKSIEEIEATAEEIFSHLTDEEIAEIRSKVARQMLAIGIIFSPKSK